MGDGHSDGAEVLFEAHEVDIVIALVGELGCACCGWRLSGQAWAESILLIIISLTITLGAGYAYLQGTSVFAGPFTQIAAACLLVSPLAIVGLTRWPGALVLAIALSQIGIATWFHPFPK